MFFLKWDTTTLKLRKMKVFELEQIWAKIRKLGIEEKAFQGMEWAILGQRAQRRQENQMRKNWEREINQK